MRPVEQNGPVWGCERFTRSLLSRSVEACREEVRLDDWRSSGFHPRMVSTFRKFNGRIAQR